MKNWKTPKLKKLAKTLISIEKESDMQNFLRDLCTIEELDEISNRWEAVGLLDKGIPYREVASKTGMSTTTVTRIAHWMKHGEDGYKKALKK